MTCCNSLGHYRPHLICQWISLRLCAHHYHRIFFLKAVTSRLFVQYHPSSLKKCLFSTLANFRVSKKLLLLHLQVLNKKLKFDINSVYFKRSISRESLSRDECKGTLTVEVSEAEMFNSLRF